MSEVLLIHAGFRGLSRRGVRAEAFIEYLLDAYSGGTVLMPAMSWRAVTPEHPVFDERDTPSETGVLSEVFRTKYATHRSLHPTHSVAGAGPHAARLLGSHHLSKTPCDMESPYGKLHEFDTHVTFLGVSVECCTALHHVEEVTHPGRYLWPAVESYTCVDRHGGAWTVRTRRHNSEPRHFGAILADVPRRNGEIFGVPWISMSLADIYRAGFSWMARAA